MKFRIQKSSCCWKDISRPGQVGLPKNSMFCVLPIFHEREMHLLNLEASDSFKGNFIWVSKIIVNICTVVVFIIPQYKIANFYWFIYLIRTFTENAFYIYALELI